MEKKLDTTIRLEVQMGLGVRGVELTEQDSGLFYKEKEFLVKLAILGTLSAALLKGYGLRIYHAQLQVRFYNFLSKVTCALMALWAR